LEQTFCHRFKNKNYADHHEGDSSGKKSNLIELMHENIYETCKKPHNADSSGKKEKIAMEIP
jgi:hypothetical protein